MRLGFHVVVVGVAIAIELIGLGLVVNSTDFVASNLFVVVAVAAPAAVYSY